jgi:transposase-like protein
MKGTRHSEEQIIAILKQGEAGVTTAELCRQHGITEQTYYRWKAKYGGMESGDAKTPSRHPGAQSLLLWRENSSRGCSLSKGRYLCWLLYYSATDKSNVFNR